MTAPQMDMRLPNCISLAHEIVEPTRTKDLMDIDDPRVP